MAGMNYKLVDAGIYNALFNQKSVAIRASIKATPGQSVQEIATDTGDTVQNVEIVTETMETIGTAIRRTGIKLNKETLVVWNAADFSDAVESNLQAAVQWVDDNPNGLMSDLQQDLGVTYEIAMALTTALQWSMKIQPIREL